MINERSKLPLKVALALTLAIVSALWLGWEKPYWAAFAVIVMSVTETTGHSLRKGRHRLFGTLIGVIAAFLLIGFFAQKLLPLLLCFTIFTGFCVYMQANTRNGYIWSISLMVCTLILVMGKMSAELSFTVAVLRLQETLLGIVCFTLVFSLLWPVSSRQLLLTTLQGFFAEQQVNTDKTADALAGNAEYSQGLGFGDGLKFLTRLEDLIPAAKTDSYHVNNEAKAWTQFLTQCREWALLCGHLSEACELLGPTGVTEDKETIQALLTRVKQRLANAETLLHTSATANTVIDITATNDNPAPKQITLQGSVADDPQRHGAILLLVPELNALDRLSSEMLQTLQAALAQAPLMVTMPVKTPSPSWGLEPERLCQALKTCVVLWICIGLWLYVPMTGGPMIVMLGVILGSVVMTMPFCNVKTLLYYMLGWSSFILLQYVFVMPHFTELWQLAAFYFLNCFGIWYWFSQPQQILSRMLGSQLLVLMTMGALKLQPEYDIQFALLQLLLIVVVMLVIFFVNHALFPSQPERVFLRHINLLRHLFAWQLRCISLTEKMGHSLLRKSLLRKSLLGQGPLRSVMIAELALTRIDWAGYPALDKEQVNRIIPRLYAVNLRLLSLQDSYVSWLQQESAPAMTVLPAETMTVIANLLTGSGNVYQLQPLAEKLELLQSQLQQYMLTLNTDSAQPIAVAPEQAVQTYQVLAALKLLIADLKQLNTLVSQANLHELKHSYFAL